VNCIICNLNCHKTADKEIFYCIDCKHFSYIPETLNHNSSFNHEALSDSLLKIRKKNAHLIHKKFQNITNLNKKYVEVGAGKGYLISQFLPNAISCTAIDMDDTFERELTEKGIDFVHLLDHEIKDLSMYECFLSSHFLEHIQNPDQFLKLLNRSNVEYLVIEVPTNDGVIFKLSKILNNIGLTASWDRMFQKESNSPHFQYFSNKSMHVLFQNNDYQVVDRLKLPLVEKVPNFKRISATESNLVSFFIAIALPLLDMLNRLLATSDVVVYFAKLHK